MRRVLPSAQEEPFQANLFLQVPEDLLSILNDPHLFANGADVTTKDILKRYGDISRRPQPKQHMIVTSSPPQSREGGRPPSTPVFHRVDSDLTQSVAWQRESSARPSGGPPPASSSQLAQPQQALNGQGDSHGQGVQTGQNGQEEQNRNWGSRQPSQGHQPLGAG